MVKKFPVKKKKEIPCLGGEWIHVPERVTTWLISCLPIQSKKIKKEIPSYGGILLSPLSSPGLGGQVAPGWVQVGKSGCRFHSRTQVTPWLSGSAP